MLMRIAGIVLDALEPSITERPFLFGSRPPHADFALFGQICQFTLDLAAITPCQARAPYTMEVVPSRARRSSASPTNPARGVPI